MNRILTAAAALLFSVATIAQSNDAPPPAAGTQMPQGRPQRAPMTPDQRAKRETDQINSVMPLGDMYQKVQDVNFQDAQKQESITNGTKRSDLTEDQRSQLKALRESHQANLKAVMGPDNYNKYKAAEKAKREEMRNSGRGAAPQPQGGGGQGN